jgi:transposase
MFVEDRGRPLHQKKVDMFYCGIDVAKHSHTMIVIDKKGDIVEPALEVTNDQKGINRLDQLLFTYRDQLHISLEATGHYWLALYERLSDLDYSLSVFNPMQIHAYRKIDLRKRKTDRKDTY